jgi:hypothetical protein
MKNFNFDKNYMKQKQKLQLEKIKYPLLSQYGKYKGVPISSKRHNFHWPHHTKRSSYP